MIPDIICYTGGCCGDLICSIIDNTDTSLDTQFKRIDIDPNRSRLKKPHTFLNDVEKDRYLIEMQTYKIIPSHDIQYHNTRQHDFIGIRVQDKNIALWAASRFKNLHRPHVWEEMQKYCGASTIEEYSQVLIDFGNLISQSTERIINLEDIVDGSVISSIEQLTNFKISDEGKNLYKEWLILNDL